MSHASRTIPDCRPIFYVLHTIYAIIACAQYSHVLYHVRVEYYRRDTDESDDDTSSPSKNRAEQDEGEQADMACSFSISEEDIPVWNLFKNSSDDYIVDAIALAELWAQHTSAFVNEGKDFSDAAVDALRLAAQALTSNDTANRLPPVITPRMTALAARLLERYWNTFGDRLYQTYLSIIEVEEGEITPDTTDSVS